MAGIGHCLYKREKAQRNLDMHREIQIKQFPIVTTHWWPKTRNEWFVWEKEQYLYRFLPLVHNHVQVIWVRTHIRCVTCVCARALAHAAFTRGVGVNAWRRACLKRGAEKLRQHHASDTRTHTRHTHVTHRMRVRTQITWTWLCTRGKKRYKYCSFSHTNRSFRVLGHQCVVTMGNCLIWISLCMFFFPLIETVTYTCHYMTDRLERFDLKTSKLDLLKKKRHLHLGCPWGKLIDTKF